jgi:transcriptional regulator with XRE-family HTH domain
MIASYQITGRQIAAARSLAGLSQAHVAEEAGVSLPTLRRMEAAKGPVAGLRNNVAAVRRVLEKSGIEFLSDNHEDGVVMIGCVIRIMAHMREVEACMNDRTSH